MTVSSTTNRAGFVCNGVTYQFPFDFKILAESDLQVYLYNTTTRLTTQLTLNVDYTVEIASPGPGGTVTLIGAYGPPCPPGVIPGAEYTITLLRSMPRTQEIDFVNGDSLDEANIEGLGDRITMMVQELDNKMARTLAFPPTSEISNISVPDPVAGAFLRWNLAGDGLENATYVDPTLITVSDYWRAVIDGGDNLPEALTAMGLDPDIATLALPANVTISSFMKTLLDDADAATARSTLNAGTSGIFLTGDQGTVGIFGQNTAPSGWTIDTNHADCVLALKGGSGKYNANGGTTAGSWSHLHATQGHALTTDQMPSHYHTVTVQGNTANNTPTYISGGSTSVTTAYFNTSSAGSGASHNHGDVTGAKELTGDSPGSWRPLASLCIRAIKN